jgi:hypothetical protein
MGRLAESYGLVQGLRYRGRIKDALLRVLAIDPKWMQGSADRALGWWYHRVPGLFGRSEAQAETHLRKALAYNPRSTATLFFLSEVVAERGRTEEARALLQQVLDAPLDPDWAPEDRDFKRQALEKLRTPKFSTCKTPPPPCVRSFQQGPFASVTAAPQTSDPCTRRT